MPLKFEVFSIDYLEQKYGTWRYLHFFKEVLVFHWLNCQTRVASRGLSRRIESFAAIVARESRIFGRLSAGRTAARSANVVAAMKIGSLGD